MPRQRERAVGMVQLGATHAISFSCPHVAVTNLMQGYIQNW